MLNNVGGGGPGGWGGRQDHDTEVETEIIVNTAWSGEGGLQETFHFKA